MVGRFARLVALWSVVGLVGPSVAQEVRAFRHPLGVFEVAYPADWSCQQRGTPDDHAVGLICPTGRARLVITSQAPKGLDLEGVYVEQCVEPMRRMSQGRIRVLRPAMQSVGGRVWLLGGGEEPGVIRLTSLVTKVSGRSLVLTLIVRPGVTPYEAKLLGAVLASVRLGTSSNPAPSAWQPVDDSAPLSRIARGECLPDQASGAGPYGGAGSLSDPPSIAPDTVDMLQELNAALDRSCRDAESRAAESNAALMRQYQQDEAERQRNATALGLPPTPAFVPPLPVYPDLADMRTVVASSPRLARVQQEVNLRQTAYERYLEQVNPRGYARMKERVRQQWEQIRARNLELANKAQAMALNLSSLSALIYRRIAEH